MNRAEILEQFSKLLDVMNDLREKCPWDQKQTMETIRTLTIEETYELSEAIIENNPEEIKKELGDILLHIVFYSKIANEKDQFDVGEVCKSLIEKLIRRHPHIYGEVKVDGAEEVLQNWEQIKLQEKGSKKNGILDGVPKGLNGLVKAYRMQEKASQVGFDWDEAEKAYEKVTEEWQEAFLHSSRHAVTQTRMTLTLTLNPYPSPYPNWRLCKRSYVFSRKMS